jgi:hypothetical protein
MSTDELLIAQSRPITSRISAQNVNADAVRYGLLVGGFPRLDLSGDYIGDWSVGHLEILRRQLTPFTEQEVGSRAETPEAINQRLSVDNFEASARDGRGGMFPGASPPSYVRKKSPMECAYAVEVTYGIAGFTVLEPLTGLAKPIEGRNKTYDHTDAITVFKSVVGHAVDGAEVYTFNTLVEFMSHLNSANELIPAYNFNADLSKRAYELKDLLAEKTQMTYATLFQQAADLQGEVDAYKLGHPGRAGLNQVEEELFREVGRPIPSSAPVVERNTAGTDTLAQAILESNELTRQQNAEFQRMMLASMQNKAPRAAKGE